MPNSTAPPSQSTPELPPDQLAAFVTEFVGLSLNGRYFAVATLTFVLYDYWLTFEDEIAYVYRTRVTLPKLIFILNRYFVIAVFATNQFALFAENSTDRFCLNTFRLTVAGSFVTSSLVNIYLSLRVYALWDRNRVMGIFLTVLVCITSIAYAVVAGISVAAVTVLPPLYLPIGKCLFSQPPFFWAPYVPSVVFETTILGLTLFRANQLGAGSSTPIITHLVRTGVMYFAVITVTTLFIAIAIFANDVRLVVTIGPSGILPAMTSVTCTRLMLYIRSAHNNRTAPRMPLDNLNNRETAFSPVSYEPVGFSGIELEPEKNTSESMDQRNVRTSLHAD